MSQTQASLTRLLKTDLPSSRLSFLQAQGTSGVFYWSSEFNLDIAMNAT